MLLSLKTILLISMNFNDLKLSLNCFYKIFAKKRNSHCHFKCMKNHKVITRSCCLSAIILLSFILIEQHKYPTVICCDFIFHLIPLCVLRVRGSNRSTREDNWQQDDSRTSYRNGRNTEALIIENLEPVEITKKLFQHHLNIFKNV